MASSLRVVIAHEWLVRYAGSERVVSSLLAEFPDAELLTAVVAPESVPPELRRAQPSFLQHIPATAAHHDWLLPALPAAWRFRRPVSDVDLVISSSHSCAKAVRVADGIPHLCYCHTPMRYAWFFEDEKQRLPRALRVPARPAMAAFRRWDVRVSRGVTRFVANSTAVADRIRDFYGRDATVIHPPVRTEFFTPGDGDRDGFLFVGRLVSYKRPDILIDAFRESPHRLTIVGGGHLAPTLRRSASANIRFIEEVTDDELRTLYRSAQALIFPGVEDFGIVLAEAQACGLPVIAAAAGGARDIVKEGETGWLVPRSDGRTIRAAVEVAASTKLDPLAIAESAQRFSVPRFRAEIRAAAEELVASASTGG